MWRSKRAHTRSNFHTLLKREQVLLQGHPRCIGSPSPHSANPRAPMSRPLSQSAPQLANHCGVLPPVRALRVTS
jgi:hypothetical protein